MSRLKSLNKLPSARAFSAVENGRLEVLELVALFLLRTETCNANTFVKVDAQTAENCRQAISYVQGSCCPKLQLQKTGLSKTYGEYSVQYKKNNFMLNAGDIMFLASWLLHAALPVTPGDIVRYKTNNIKLLLQ